MNSVISTAQLGMYAVLMLISFWPVTILLVLLAVMVVIFRPPALKRESLWLLLPLPLPLLILLWGGFMAAEHESPPNNWQSIVLKVLVLAFLPCACFILKSCKGFRLTALTIVLLEAWFTLCCAYIAAMSVSNTWL